MARWHRPPFAALALAGATSAQVVKTASLGTHALQAATACVEECPGSRGVTGR